MIKSNKNQQKTKNFFTVGLHWLFFLCIILVRPTKNNFVVSLVCKKHMYDKLSFLVRKDAVLKKEEFTQKVAELIELAHKKEDRLTINEIQDFFKDDDLTEKQKTDVITELTGKKINVNMGVDVNEPKAPKADSAKSDDADNDFPEEGEATVDLVAEPTDEDIAMVAADEGGLTGTYRREF